jgi:hypothetical protein
LEGLGELGQGWIAIDAKAMSQNKDDEDGAMARFRK